MAITKATITDTMIGTVVSPFPDGWVTRMAMTQAQSPAWQTENHFAFPLPFGTWRSGRFVLRDLGGAGMRVINVSTQCGALTGGYAILTNGQSFRYRGDLLLECLPQNQEWEIDFSDVPVVAVADPAVAATLKAVATRFDNYLGRA
jgi:hypothetical protein